MTPDIAAPLFIKPILFLLAALKLVTENWRTGQITNQNNVILFTAGLGLRLLGPALGIGPFQSPDILPWVALALVLVAMFALRWIGGGAAKFLIALLPWFSAGEYLFVAGAGFLLGGLISRLRGSREAQIAPPMALLGLIVLSTSAATAPHSPPPGITACLALIIAFALGVGVLAAQRRNRPPPQPAANPPKPMPDPARVVRAVADLEKSLAALHQAYPPTASVAEPAPRFGKAAALTVPETVPETVTVVLRRQIPPRFDEPPRSWLGGLPMLPEGVAWPRSISSEYPERGERPLHFVAQIACADLPPDLWGGLGPRQGWLLLFLDPNQGSPEDSDAFKILHTETLGTERAPPIDLGPVHDGVYTAWDFGHYGGQAGVPQTWRRWPVDLVAMPNELDKQDDPARDLSRRLYEGAPVADRAARLPHPTPFTRRGALYALNSALYPLNTARPPQPLSPKLAVNLNAPNGIEQIRAALETQRDKLRGTLAERRAAEPPATPPDAQNAALDKEIANREYLLAFLSNHPTPAALIAYFEESNIRGAAWQAECRARLERLRDNFQKSDLDAAFTEAEWAELRAEAGGQPYQRVTYHIWGDKSKNPTDPTPPVGLFLTEQSLKLESGRGSLELVADYYVDPARHALIPPHLLPDFETSWRRLRDDRPHRMGGYQDGVQSTPETGPAKYLLLFQIASDDAMHWCWGDVGAYYLYARPADLRRGDYAHANIVLECH